MLPLPAAVRRPVVMIALAVLTAAAPAPAAGAPLPDDPAVPQVWVGGGLALSEMGDPANAAKWAYVRAHADGYYTNNFVTRYRTDAEQAALLKKFRAVRAVLPTARLFYETDLIHSTDDHDRDSLDLFRRAGFDTVGVTINYGNSPARTQLLTDAGRLPLYYMVGPRHKFGDFADGRNAKDQAGMLAAAGGAMDCPVVLYSPHDHDDAHADTRTAVRWCHAHGKKFLLLLAPNDSGKDFLPDAQQLVADLDAHDAHPDLWAVSFYGPPVFRKTLDVLPETNPDGSPAPTFTGVACWLLHHLHDHR